MNHVLMIFFALLISMSIIFIVVEIRANFDRSFLAFGIVNLLICSFCIIDILIQPSQPILHWTVLQHIIASFLPPSSFWLIMLILNRARWPLIKSLFLVGIAFTILFLSGTMLESSGNEVKSNLLYNITFVPYIVMSELYLFGEIVINLKLVPINQRRIIHFYLVGMIFLALGSLLDIVSIIVGLHGIIPSYSFLGATGFSIAVTIIFTEKLSSIIREREITFNKLRETYKDLEEVQALKELGQSTAIINHEIRNYTAAISGYSEMLGMSPSLDERTKKIVSRISDCIMHLNNFSNDILEFSRSRILKDKIPLDLKEMINNCIDIHFQNNKEMFQVIIEKSEYDTVITGDKNKLEQVFVNIFKNSIEAKSRKIRISMTSRETLLFCTVDDDGIGCTQEQVVKIFKSFFTTKKNDGGTGLGMCVVRSIIEVHGGYISAYSKNIMEKGEHGLSLHITFPRYEMKDAEAEKKHDIILIKEDIKNLATLIRIFQNVLINPYVMQNVHELEHNSFERPEMTIIAAPSQLALLRTKYNFNANAFAIVEGANELPYIVHKDGNEYPVLFSEEYLLKKIMAALN